METTTEIAPTLVAEAKDSIANLTVQVGAITVRDAESFEAAGQQRLALKRYLARVDEICDPAIRAGHDAHKAALAVKAKLTDPAKALDADLQRKRVTWQEAEQRRLDEIARQAEAAQRKAEEDARLAEAAAAEQAGDHAQADAIIEAPMFVAPVIAQAPPKTAGIATRTTWSARVTDFAALVRAVAEGKAPLTALKADQTVLNGLARSMREHLRIPGIQAVPTVGEAVRA